MVRHKDHFHGSDLEKIEKIYGIKKEEIISFSTNVNPYGISPLLRDSIVNNADVISRYPDRDYYALKEAIASYCGCRTEHIIVGNGTSELISLFIRILHPNRALILGPTYSEYERSISLLGGQCVYYPLSEKFEFSLQIDDFCEHLRDDLDLVVICNPNNPTSSCISSLDLRKILDCCKAHGIMLMIDETYVEFVADIDSVSAVKLCDFYNNVIVLRGTSKFFAAPGLRLGYAVVGDADILQDLGRFKSPWMINAIAEVCGAKMFSDTSYIKKTRDLMAKERSFMYDTFSSSERFRPFYPHANFMLLRILDPDINASSLFETCIRKKYMIRDCSTFPFLSDRFIRICFMTHEENERLLSILVK